MWGWMILSWKKYGSIFTVYKFSSVGNSKVWVHNWSLHSYWQLNLSDRERIKSEIYFAYTVSNSFLMYSWLLIRCGLRNGVQSRKTSFHSRVWMPGGGDHWGILEAALHSNQERKKVKSLGRVWIFVTPWTVACPAPPSMGFSRQEHWSGLSFLSSGGLPDSGIEPAL